MNDDPEGPQLEPHVLTIPTCMQSCEKEKSVKQALFSLSIMTEPYNGRLTLRIARQAKAYSLQVTVN